MKRLMTIMAAAGLLAALPNAVRADDGAENFNKKCATCHGKDGTGHTPMGEKLKAKDLSKDDIAEDKIVATITTGIPEKKMPAFKDKLSDDEMKDVAKYVKTLKKN